MYTMVSLRHARWVAWTMTCLFGIPYLGSGALAAVSNDVFVQSAVLFPLDNMVEDEQNAPKAAKAAEELNAFLRQGFSNYPRYMVMVYSERLPAVQRLRAAQMGKKDQISGPFSGDPSAVDRAVSLARRMSADLAIGGSLDFYKFVTEKAEKADAEITATVHILDVKTGKTVTAVTTTGRAAVTPVGAEGITESKLVSRAVRDLGGKIMREITGGRYDGSEPFKLKTAKKRSGKKSWLPLLLLSLGVGLLLGSSGDGGGGGGSDSGSEPPPPPPF